MLEKKDLGFHLKIPPAASEVIDKSMKEGDELTAIQLQSRLAATINYVINNNHLEQEDIRIGLERLSILPANQKFEQAETIRMGTG